MVSSRISCLGKQYDDGKTYENELEKVFLCRSVCIVITSL